MVGNELLWGGAREMVEEGDSEMVGVFSVQFMTIIYLSHTVM